MRVYSIDVTINSQNLKDLIDNPAMRHTKQISLQAPKKNFGTIFFGDQKNQPIELRPRASADLPIATFNNLYIKGLLGDKLTIVFLDD